MIGVFGLTPPIIFGASPLGTVTFEDMSKTQEARWADHEVHLSLPLSEFIGPNLSEIEFTMNFIQGWTMDPTLGIIAVETAINLSLPGPLIIGLKPMGRGMSLFTIRSIVEKPKFFQPNNGSILAATIGVKLKEYIMIPSLGLLNYL